MGEDNDPAPTTTTTTTTARTTTTDQPNAHHQQQQRRSQLSRSLDGELKSVPKPLSGATAAADDDDAGAAPRRPSSPGRAPEGAATPGPRKPAVLNLQPLNAGDAGGSADMVDDEPGALDSPGGASGASPLRRAQSAPHGHHQHAFHRPHSHSPSSLSASMASSSGGLLQAVPEDAVVDSPSPSAGDHPPESSSAAAAAAASSSSGTAGGGALRGAAGSPALLGISSSFCSEVSIDSPSINLTLPCHELLSGMLVAMVNRSAEMKELYERNAPFFDQITSCVLLGGVADAAGADGKEKQAQQEPPPRVRQFLDTLFAPREQLPDRPWMEAIESQLANATPAMLQTFRELVGYVDEDDDDAGIPEGDQVWLPEYDELEDTADLAAGFETDDIEDKEEEDDDGAVPVARRQTGASGAGRAGADGPPAVGTPSGRGPEGSKEKPLPSRGKMQEGGEEVTVEALAV